MPCPNLQGKEVYIFLCGTVFTFPASMYGYYVIQIIRMNLVWELLCLLSCIISTVYWFLVMPVREGSNLNANPSILLRDLLSYTYIRNMS